MELNNQFQQLSLEENKQQPQTNRALSMEDEQIRLDTLQFGNLNITIYGTDDQPLIKCSDLLIHVLGYRDSSAANWFKSMKKDSYFVTPVDQSGQQFFTEQGIYKALMKSNKPVAEIFQRQVCELLTHIRKQIKLQLLSTQQQLEQNDILFKQQLAIRDQQIQALKYPNPESIYKIYQKSTNILLYIGKDKSQSQQRRYQHLTQRNNITQLGYQLIDLKLATLDINDIGITYQQCQSGTSDNLEQQLIQDLKPLYNIAMTDNLFRCLCNPEKVYKNRKSYEKHMQLVHNQELLENANNGDNLDDDDDQEDDYN